MKKYTNLIPFKVFANLVPTLATRLVHAMLKDYTLEEVISPETLLNFIDNLYLDACEKDDLYKDLCVPP